jgi:uncharacterized protein YabN with tetrapyrrole methylase and pyrophosphatase domain
VFGDVTVSGAEEVLTNWERIKARERGERGEVDADIPGSLPALARAAKVQRRAAGWGFDRRTRETAMEGLRDEVDELDSALNQAEVEDEVGDVLFATVALARKHGVDAEGALRRTTRRFADRYERFAALAEERGLNVDDLDDDEARALFREAR